MKITTKCIEPPNSGIKLGIVHLGPAAGKFKYTLFDKEDIDIVQEMWFEAYVDIDRNGEGVCVYALVSKYEKRKSPGRYMHELLWEKHFGGIAPGFKVIHKNGITVDNRLENLALFPKDTPYKKNSNFNPKDSLYWAAIEEIPYEIVPTHTKLLSPNEETTFSDDERFYECHYLPCTNMEQTLQEFSICSRCQMTRYCSPQCQGKDWPWHKPHCHKAHAAFRTVFPDR